MIYVEVIIKYRDDKGEIMNCDAPPYIDSTFITLYPLRSALGRRLIRPETVSDIKWDYKCNHMDYELA
jgi:hypothetical protein